MLLRFGDGDGGGGARYLLAQQSVQDLTELLRAHFRTTWVTSGNNKLAGVPTAAEYGVCDVTMDVVAVA